MAEELDGHWGRRKEWYQDPVRPGPNDRLVAQGNMQLYECIIRLGAYWNDAHPDVRFVWHQDSHTYERDKGYLVYALTARRPMANDAKARFHRQGPDLNIFRQSFENIVKFSAVHIDPQTAEQIIDNFENFMIEATPYIMSKGIQNVFYGGRLADDAENRIGEDVSVHSIQYSLLTQKLLVYRTARLEHIYARFEIIDRELDYDQTDPATPDSPATPPSDVVLLHMEYGATPNMIWGYEPE
jgi:hypothetical protein